MHLGCLTSFLAILGLSLSAPLSGQRAPEQDPPSIKASETDAADELKALLNETATEWVFHKTEDDSHPSGEEQAMVWLMNRARSAPAKEGEFLANTGDPSVEQAIRFFEVDLSVMQEEFAVLPARPPAAFDRRIYEGSLRHSEDLIERDSQDHDNQFERVQDAGFQMSSANASVFSYAENPVYAHAGFNIDWGNGTDDGMQEGRGHRVGLMSSGQSRLTNVGIAMVPETDSSTSVGPLVTSIVYARAATQAANHFNKFVVGTVWEDENQNGMYDPSEGLSGVQVMPNTGSFFAVTGAAGGYAIPIEEDGVYVLTFRGGDLREPETRQVEVLGESVLVVWNAADSFASTLVEPRLGIRSTDSGELELFWSQSNGDTLSLQRYDHSTGNWVSEEGEVSVNGDLGSFPIPLQNAAEDPPLYRLKLEP